jgi:hypothetical protein
MAWPPCRTRSARRHPRDRSGTPCRPLPSLGGEGARRNGRTPGCRARTWYDTFGVITSSVRHARGRRAAPHGGDQTSPRGGTRAWPSDVRIVLRSTATLCKPTCGPLTRRSLGYGPYCAPAAACAANEIGVCRARHALRALSQPRGPGSARQSRAFRQWGHSSDAPDARGSPAPPAGVQWRLGRYLPHLVSRIPAAGIRGTGRRLLPAV